jgi:hypothetical protein
MPLESQMADQNWQKLDVDLIENPPARLDCSDECYYAREYAAGKGFAHSDTNQLISNLKKPVSARGTPAWKYKLRAIQQFADELACLLATIPDDFLVAHIPSSKRTDHPDYDRRLEDVVNLAVAKCPRATQVAPVLRAVTLTPAHQSGASRPSPLEVRASLTWNGLKSGRELLFVDDVVTSGTTFKECKRLVERHAPTVSVCGVFWARTIWDG